MHVQVIVSRKDISNKIKLSPQNTSRGRNARHSKKMGQYDSLEYKHMGETLFDELFGFERELKEKLAYSNAKKNGTVKQKAQNGRAASRERVGQYEKNKGEEEQEKK